ncbi:MAG: HAMP domain-containing protein [bacterium]|nr:HAMP domain-containing protein [bacterium]MDT8366856.1 HAMP domain-containing protein [bacterium]
MFRKFATREIVNVAGVVTGFTIVCCILLYTFVKADMKEDSIRYEVALADTILRSMKYEMIVSDRGALQQIISDISKQERVRYARIFNCSGVISFSSDKEETGRKVDRQSEACKKCHRGSKPVSSLDPMERASVHVSESGERIMSLMTPIYNEAACSTAECHYHPPDKLMLGGMDFGLSQEQLEHSLSRLRLRMIIFCVMILILTVAGVTALLWRGVMQPLGELVDFASQCYEGKHEDDPPIGSSEISHIGEILQKLAVDKSILSAKAKKEDDPAEGDQGG